MSNTNNQKLFAVIGAVVTWFAVIAQFVVTYRNAVGDATFAMVNLFSYFTILTNIVVASAFTAFAFEGKRSCAWFSNAGTQTAILVYIIVVGAIYSLLLRGTWSPQGFQKVVDELLHTAVPLLFLFYWLFYTPKKELSYSIAIKQLVYPALYLVFTLVRGTITGIYPYFFVDVSRLGYKSVAVNSVAITMVFVLLALMLIAGARYRYRKG